MAEAEAKPKSVSTNTVISRSMITDPSVIIKWMDTDPLLNDLKENLLGRRYFEEVDHDTGKTKWLYQTIGEQKVNEQGVLDIVTFLKSNITHHASLGTFTREEDYYEYLRRVHYRFIDVVKDKRIAWELDVKNLKLIFSIVMSLVERLSSRSIGDMERKHLATAYEGRETMVRERDPKFKIPFFGGRRQ